MTIHTDRITLVFPIAAKNRQAAASLQTLEITESGNEFEKLVPIDPASVSQYASQFNLPLLERVTELENDLATKTSQLEAITQAKTALDLRVATLTTEKQALTTELADTKAELGVTNQQLATVTASRDSLLTQLAASDDALELANTSLATANQTTERLQSEVVKLTAIRQYNPRWTTPDYFINRFTAHEAKAFYSSNDPIIVGGRKLLEEYETATPPYHVDLDDERVQGLTGYMVQIGMLSSMERRAQVLSDVSAQEAFYPA